MYIANSGYASLLWWRTFSAFMVFDMVENTSTKNVFILGGEWKTILIWLEMFSTL